ncbi:hypothetical protein SynROS8604_01857 [Synechococcus sp. ROS8604]|nr:hypothetical protein SynROS8604_01857 [Synechococcus sp. ROS8604]
MILVPNSQAGGQHRPTLLDGVAIGVLALQAGSSIRTATCSS